MNIHSKITNWLLRFSLYAALLIFGAHANAVGTTADTWVGNSATLDFSVGGVGQDDLISSPTGNSDPTLTLQAGAPGTAPGGGEVGYTEFIVDRVLDLLVTSNEGAYVPVVPEQTNATLYFTVENQGNADSDVYLMAVYNQSASIAGLDSLSGEDGEYFRAGAAGSNAIRYYLEDDGVAGVYDGGETQLTNDVTTGFPFLDELAPDTPTNILVVVDISTASEIFTDVATNDITTAALLDGALSAITLVAQSGDAGNASATADGVISNDDNTNASPGGSATGATPDDPTTVEDVFADNAAYNADAGDTILTEDVTFDFATPATANTPFGGFGSETTDTANNGQASDTAAFLFATADLTLTKTVATVCDNILLTSVNAKAIPGSYQLYTISVTNDAAAGASASLTTLTDTFDTGGLVTFDPDYDDLSAITVSCDEDGPLDGAGNGFQVDVTGSSRVGTFPAFFTSANDADGADLDSPTSIGLDYSLLLPVDAGGSGYTVGELKPGETVTVTFQVVID